MTIKHYLGLLAFGLALGMTGCGEAKQIYDCAEICDSYSTCIDNDVSEVDCTSACESHGDEDMDCEQLAYLVSRPLAELLRPLGKDSDNFTAEMILLALSAAKPSPSRREPDATSGDAVGEPKPSPTEPSNAESPWSSQRGAARLLAWLGDGQIPTAKLRIENGSGLFDANRLTTDGIALTLARMEARPEVFAEFLSQLSIYGTDGTLRNRHKDHESRSRVRAKTGTLRDTDALSGYVLRPSGKRPLVFSLIVTGARGGHGEVRAELDQTVFAWLEALAGS
jgi:D-alanyl-D-alanine carboxypeptidase/D-alanyl-D-alanine-endopeptidase (penicillin-binding protein 4)